MSDKPPERNQSELQNNKQSFSIKKRMVRVATHTPVSFILLIKKIARSFSKESLLGLTRSIWDFLTFGLLLFMYVMSHFLLFVGGSRFWPKRLARFPSEKVNGAYERVTSLLDHHGDKKSIARVELMEIAIRNMQMKRTRSFVTIGGMAIGIGAIVFLVSIGYGLQDLVVSRVARLEEMKQIDVSVQAGSKLYLTDVVLQNVKKIRRVKNALPMIGVVAKISYKLSVSDVPAYGVTAEYLENSAIKPVKGKIFLSNATKLSQKDVADIEVLGLNNGDIRGEYGDVLRTVRYSIEPNQWVPVRSKPSLYAPLFGYTKRQPGYHYGVEYIGSYYERAEEIYVDGEGETLAVWLQAGVPVWKKEQCDEVVNVNCVQGQYVRQVDEVGGQVVHKGYMSLEYMQLEEMTIEDLQTAYESAQVLGTSSAVLGLSEATGSSLLDLDLDALIASEAGIIEEQKIKQVVLGNEAVKEAIVNRAMLKLLGIPEDEAIGKEFESSFVIVGNLTTREEKIESKPAKYKIVGVIPSESSPFFYVPFIDLRSLGVENYSQIKILADNQDAVTLVREEIESLGFATTSVVDTVTQINTLFETLRLILALLGTVALAVAAFGMFNTLTVSLLERTHEVGLMKAMGMKSHEVQELFLTESMVMGFAGGIFGLLIGWMGGRLAGIFVSIFAFTKGVGYINVASIPLIFVIIILVLSMTVGLLTGIYPARRAKHISALDALRYE